MKQKFMKKALAVVLSTAMVFSLSASAQMQSASAAKKFVSLNTTFKTLKVGQKYKLKLTNNTSNWKVKKVVTTDKSIATVYGKTSSNVMVKGKSTGRATIRVHVETAARKNNNQKTLRCRVKVVDAGQTAVTPTPTPAPTPTPTPSPGQTNTQKTVSTQTELDAALSDASVTGITISTTAAASFTIPSGQHTNTDLTVNAPNADVTNNATFKSVTIKAIKNETWTEKARGNNLKVEALKARIVVDTAANVAGITVASANADVTIVVNGTAAGITINAKAKVNILGTTTTKVPVTIAAAATDTALTAAIPVELRAAANASVELSAGAEESTVQVTSNTATVSVKNNTTKKVAVTDANNKKSEVSPKGSLTVKPSNTTTGTGGWSGSGWTGTGSGSSGGSGSYVPDYSTKTVTTKDELKTALDDTRVRTIYLKTAENLMIDAADYSDRITLIVDSPKATIENHAEFRSIDIRNIASETWREFGKKNRIAVSAPIPHIVIGEGAVVNTISFTGTQQKATLTVHGTIQNAISCATSSKESSVTMDVKDGAKVEKGIIISKAMSVVILGVQIKIPVVIAAAEVQLSSEVPVDITLKEKDANIWLKETATGSTLDYANKDLEVTINTKVEVTTTIDGKATDNGSKIEAGTNGTVDTSNEKIEGSAELPPDMDLPNPPEVPDDGNTENPGGETPDPGTETPTGTPAIVVSGVTSGAGIVVTPGAFTVGGQGVTPEYGTASYNNETASYVSGAYVFNSNVAGTITFTAATSDITYTVTVTIPDSFSATSAQELTATVTAPSGSDSSGS